MVNVGVWLQSADVISCIKYISLQLSHVITEVEVFFPDSQGNASMPYQTMVSYFKPWVVRFQNYCAPFAHRYNSITLFITVQVHLKLSLKFISKNNCIVDDKNLLINLSPLYASSTSSACEVRSLWSLSRSIRSLTLPRSRRSRLREFLITLLLSLKRRVNSVTVFTSFLGLWIQ